MARQVRIDDTVAEALAARWGDEVSLSAAANADLRVALGLKASLAPPEPPQERHQERPVSPSGAPGAGAGKRPAQTSRRPGAIATGRCRHPINRRIGEHCAACGARVA